MIAEHLQNALLQPTHNIPARDYRNRPEISRSDLGHLLRSPRHYWSKKIDPARIETSYETPAMRLGTAVHMAALEPDRFSSGYGEGPMVSRSTKVWKEAQAATKATLLPPDEFRLIAGIVKSLQDHDAASKALFRGNGSNEATFITKDAASGIGIKCRADRVTSGGFVVDLKTTQDASARAFGKSVVNFNYHLQAAFYMRCIEAATGTIPKGFVFVAVEKEPPYACQVFLADDEMLSIGAKKIDALLLQLRSLTEEFGTTPWPSYSQQVQPLSLPEWALRDLS
jgi:exodeoxyribonuclease VIII